MNKKVAAREWLLLVICLFLGWTVVPLFVIGVIDGREVSRYTLSEFWWTLQRTRSIDYGAWAVFLGPYVITQFFRSLVWAVKASR